MSSTYKRKCGCTYRSSSAASARKGYEMGGYLIEQCSDCAVKQAVAEGRSVETERIVAAAHLIDGITYSMPAPARHHTILHAMDDHNAERARHAGPGSQGFLTNTGRFVKREEAGRIAIATGQIEKLKYSRTRLFSEDLW